MPLELRTQRDGRLRPSWYGRYEINGRLFRPNLFVKIGGTPPASGSLRDEGDGAFERSRAAAQAKLNGIVEEARTKQGSARLVEKLYEIKTGETIRSVTLTDLPQEWAKIARKRKPNDRYASQCHSTLKRFAAFVHLENMQATEIAHVTRQTARSFMSLESNRGVTSKTWNDTLKLLRATFKYLLPTGAINPFADLPSRETETIFRKPYSPEELAAILNAARTDEFIRPVIIVGMCTAMRRGDCCLLEWKNVDLPKRFITVKTSKTGQMVSIPIFPMLYDELAKRSFRTGTRGKAESPPHPDPLPDRGGEGMKLEGYVFPEAARMYLENPDGITWRVKKILAVGLEQEKAESGKQKAENELPQLSAEEARKRGEDFIANLPENGKRSRMAAAFKLYMDGNNIAAVMAGAKLSKGSVSGYLNEIESATGCRIIRGKSESGNRKPETTELQVERKHGLRRASVRDFHSFRVTWVTLALTAGVPLELVQKVTGHKTTDIVLKHYFQPGREAFRSALHSAMPKLLMNGSAEEKLKPETLKPEIGGQESDAKKQTKKIKQILARSTAKTWKQNQARVLEMLKGKISN